MIELGFKETDDTGLRGEAIGFLEVRHEDIETGENG